MLSYSNGDAVRCPLPLGLPVHVKFSRNMLLRRTWITKKGRSISQSKKLQARTGNDFHSFTCHLNFMDFHCGIIPSLLVVKSWEYQHWINNNTRLFQVAGLQLWKHSPRIRQHNVLQCVLTTGDWPADTVNYASCSLRHVWLNHLKRKPLSISDLGKKLSAWHLTNGDLTS